MRPLTPRGKGQAEALVEVLAPFAPTRILSSPYVRCVQTVEPLGAALHLPVEEDPALAEGHVDGAARLAAALAGGSVAVCSHGDIIPALLRALAGAAQVPLPDDPPCAKGSVWVVELSGPGAPAARYISPPA